VRVAATPRPSTRKIASRYDKWSRFYDLADTIGPLGRQERKWRAGVAERVRDMEGWALDAGCGTCRMAEELQRVCFKGRLLAVDASRKMVKRAQRKVGVLGLRGLVVLGDVSRLPLRPGCLDAVICTFSITTVAKPQDAIWEFERALRAGGRLILLDSEAPSGMLARLLYHMLVPLSRFFCHTYIDRDISGLLQAAGGLGREFKATFLGGMVCLYEHKKRADPGIHE